METPATEQPKTDRPETAAAQAPKTPKAKKAEKKAAKPALGLDDILEQLDAQDMVLKQLKENLQGVLANNVALRRNLRQAFKDASRHDELEAELATYRKKISVLKGVLN